jgi:hypothetical protein
VLSRIMQDSWEVYPSTWVGLGGVNDFLVEHLRISLQQVGIAGGAGPRKQCLASGRCPLLRPALLLSNVWWNIC